MSKLSEKIIEILNENEINTDAENLNANGVVVEHHVFSRIVDAVYRSEKDYSEIRGHVRCGSLFNISYSANYMSYERLDNTIFINGNHLTYDKKFVKELKVFVSNCDWIDFHITYDDETYATIVIVPKSKQK